MKSKILPLCLFLCSTLFLFAEQESPNMMQATETYEATIFKTLLIFFSAIGLLVLTIWLFRRMSHGRLQQMNHLKTIKVLEKRPLSPKSMLYLIDVGGQKVLIAESQVEVRKLTSFDLSPQPASSTELLESLKSSSLKEFEEQSP